MPVRRRVAASAPRPCDLTLLAEVLGSHCPGASRPRELSVQCCRCCTAGHVVTKGTAALAWPRAVALSHLLPGPPPHTSAPPTVQPQGPAPTPATHAHTRVSTTSTYAFLTHAQTRVSHTEFTMMSSRLGGVVHQAVAAAVCNGVWPRQPLPFPSLASAPPAQQHQHQQDYASGSAASGGGSGAGAGSPTGLASALLRCLEDQLQAKKFEGGGKEEFRGWGVVDTSPN